MRIGGELLLRDYCLLSGLTVGAVSSSITRFSFYCQLEKFEYLVSSSVFLTTCMGLVSGTSLSLSKKRVSPVVGLFTASHSLQYTTTYVHLIPFLNTISPSPGTAPRAQYYMYVSIRKNVPADYPNPYMHNYIYTVAKRHRGPRPPEQWPTHHFRVRLR